MFKKTIIYDDFDGNQTSQDFYFHISKVEFAAMAHGASEFETRVKRIEASKDGLAILHEFREIIRLSCGVRSDDHKRFIKTPEAQSELLDSPAFDVLVLEMMAEPKKMADFIAQLFPEKMKNELIEKYGSKEPAAEQSGDAPDPFAEPKDDRPAWQKEHRLPTKKELQSMPREEMAQAMQWRLENNKLEE